MEILTTWFILGFTIQMFPEICDAVVRLGHEVRHAGWTHVAPAKLSRKKEEDYIVRANTSIKKLSGQKALGYRSPA
jgi:peptidoglycan/xylan/chitin deacetylase (PgdA/CDA1 family)